MYPGRTKCSGQRSIMKNWKKSKMKHKKSSNIVAVICLMIMSNDACSPFETKKNSTNGTAVQAVSAAYSTPWEALMADATTAYKQGRYADAEKSLQDALMEAEQVGKGDFRTTMTLTKMGDLAATLNNLATLNRKQGKYNKAESLYKRSLAIWERILGPEHPHVAASLETYASLLRETGRNTGAERLEARAKEIRKRKGQRKSTR